MQLGYVHRFTDVGTVVPTLGAVVNVGAVPDPVAGAYGTGTPVGVYVFVGLQPPKMPIAHAHGMSGM